MTKPPVRIHAGNNGVYDAVALDSVWLIRYTPWSYFSFNSIPTAAEYSTTSYESAHEAALAYERGPIAYRANEVVA